MTAEPQTIVALLTPRGRGAIASVLVRGPQALSSVDHLFAAHGRATCAAAPIGRVLVGLWHDHAATPGTRPTGSSREELVVCRTGPDQVEVHCHGGRAAATAVIQSLRQRGCQQVEWPEALRLPQESPLRSAARIALAAARTQRTAAILLDQYNGALEQSLQQLLEEIAQADRTAAVSRLDALLRYRTLGPHLTHPWRVALAGPPNVGKSSLINAIMGFQRAVVVDDPGTTRDVVTTATVVDGWPVELSDTAGLRETTDPLEAAGINQARERLGQSNLIVLVFDATNPLSESDRALLAQWPEAIVVVNKCDLIRSASGVLPQALRTSALTRAGLDELLQRLSRRLVPHIPRAGEAVPLTESHGDALWMARDALRSNQWQRARQHVERLLAR